MCNAIVSMMLEIKSCLDIKHPMTAMLITLVLTNAVLAITSGIMRRHVLGTLGAVSQHVTFMLFAVYVIDCYRNGKAPVLATIITLLLVAAELGTAAVAVTTM